MSGGCPQCLRAAQRFYVVLLSDFCGHNRSLFKNEEIVAVSMMSPTWQARLGSLQSFDLTRVEHEVGNALDQTNFNWLLFCVDISLNDDTQKGQGVYWQIQAYGVAGVDDQHAFADALRQNFDVASETVRRPVRVAKCDGSAKALSYVFKTNFVRRIAYLGDGVTRKGEPRKCWRTRKVSLKAKEEVELRLWLNQIGIDGRVLCATWRSEK